MTPSTAKFLADAIVVAHLAFVVFALFGGVLALRWRRVALAHLPSVAWVIYVAASNAVCPLTPLENDLRRQAGDAAYEGGFVDHYLTPVLYPDGLTPEIQRRMGGGILLFNLACYAGVAHRWRTARRRQGTDAVRSPGPAVGAPAVASAPAGPAERPIATSAVRSGQVGH